MSELVFRGLRGRTLEDQQQAMVNGYHSVTEMAVDELGAMVLELRQRIEALEAREPFQYQSPPLSDARGIWTDTTRDSDAS